MATISNMTIFPIKSFDGMEIQSAKLRANGSLSGDREYKFIDEDGNNLDSLKPDPSLYQVRVTYDSEGRKAQFSMPGIKEAPLPQSFDLQTQASEISAWMSQALGKKVTLVRDAVQGFCDDQEFAGPTIISKATLDRIAEISGHADVPRRMRANIIMADMKPFEEDQLCKSEGFSLGDARFQSATPCIRCVVPMREPETGLVDGKFAKRLVAERGAQQAHNPVNPKNDYIAAVNTMADGPQTGQIRAGDALQLLAKKSEQSLSR